MTKPSDAGGAQWSKGRAKGSRKDGAPVKASGRVASVLPLPILRRRTRWRLRKETLLWCTESNRTYWGWCGKSMDEALIVGQSKKVGA